MESNEIAMHLTKALVEQAELTSLGGGNRPATPEALAEAIGKCYGIIYPAVVDAQKQIAKGQFSGMRPG